MTVCGALQEQPHPNKHQDHGSHGQSNDHKKHRYPFVVVTATRQVRPAVS
jgi:hypothetical protein